MNFVESNGSCTEWWRRNFLMSSYVESITLVKAKVVVVWDCIRSDCSSASLSEPWKKSSVNNPFRLSSYLVLV